jgi:hypothetical protein
MKLPKKQIDELHEDLRSFFEADGRDPQAAMVQADPKNLEDLILYAELANARIKELENDCSGLMFKIRCVAQALK